MGQLDGRMGSWMVLMGLDSLPRRKDWRTGWKGRLLNTGAILSLLCVILFSGVTKAEVPISKPGWSMNVSKMVEAAPESTAMLPCNVTHPMNNYTGNITVIWKRQCFQNIFECTVPAGSDICKKPERGNFRLIGSPREKDLTLQIKNVSTADSSLYVCRIELNVLNGDAFESLPGTFLLVSDEVPDPTPVECPSQNISIGLGVLCGLLFFALVLLLAYVLWSKRGKKARKSAVNPKLPSSPPSIPLEKSNPAPIYENIPRGGKPRATKSSE